MGEGIDNGEYIHAEFTSKELDLISQRAEFMAQIEDANTFFKQMYWQLSLSANHLFVMLEEEEKLEKLSLKSADIKLKKKTCSKKG